MSRATEIAMERHITTLQTVNAELQRQLDERPQTVSLETTNTFGTLTPLENNLGRIQHADAIVFSADVRKAVIAVAIRLEERADKRTLPNGAALAVVESLYERAHDLRTLCGDISEHDEEEAQELLQELIGTR